MPVMMRVGKFLFELARDAELALDADERIFGRLVAVGWREERGALDVRIVVGAAGGEIDEGDVEISQELEELDGLGEIVGGGIFCVGAKAPVVGNCAGVRGGFEDAGAGFAGGRVRGIGMERRGVEGGEADADFELRSVAADSGDDFAEEAGAIFE